MDVSANITSEKISSSRTPMAVSRRMGSVRFCPQYCPASTMSALETAKAICWTKNWIWLTAATPESEISEYEPIMTLSARFTHSTTACSSISAPDSARKLR